MDNDGVKILHIGDIHLGREFSIEGILGNKARLRSEEIWKTFENSLEFARDNQVDIVLIPGDLYENSHITISNLDRIVFLFEKYNNLEFIISLGNHDHISPKSQYLRSRSPENVYIFGSMMEYVEIDNTRVYGFSWENVEYNYFKMPFIELDKNYNNILSIHGTNTSISDYLPINVNEIENIGFDYVALAHIHIPGQVGERTFYSGCLEPLSFSDIGKRGGYFVELYNGETVSRFVEFSTRQYEVLEFDLSTIKDNRELYGEIDGLLKEIDEKNFLKLKLTGKNDNLDIGQIENIFCHRFFYFEILNLTEKAIDLNLIIENNRKNLLGKYLKYVIENYSDKEQKALIDIGLEVFPWRDEFET